MSRLTDQIRYYDWNQIKEYYDKLRLAGGNPTRLVCHPDHTSQATLALRSLGLPLRLDVKPSCPTETIYITGDEDI